MMLVSHSTKILRVNSIAASDKTETYIVSLSELPNLILVACLVKELGELFLGLLVLGVSFVKPFLALLAPLLPCGFIVPEGITERLPPGSDWDTCC